MLKKLAIFICTAVSLTAFSFTAFAWEPKDPVTIIVSYKDGSGTDNGARIVQKYAQKYLGVNVKIENISGQDGLVGWIYLIKSKADGQTIGYINLPTFTTYTTSPNPPFSITDIVPICNHLTETAVVVVKADSPFNTLQDLVASAQENGNILASTNGLKASNHTAAQLFATSAGFTFFAVDCGGTSDQLLALIHDEVQFSCAKYSDVVPFIKSDKPELKILGVFSESRLDCCPEVPTLAECGYYDKWYGSVRGLVAPKDTKLEIINFYKDAFEKMFSDPKVVEEHKQAGMELDYRDNLNLEATIVQNEFFCRDVIPALFKESSQHDN